MEENVDFHDGEHDEETGDDDYDSIHEDDTDGDDNNDCGDKQYDGSSKSYDVVLQEIGSSSEEEEDDDDDEQEVNDGIEDEFWSRVGRCVTTVRSRRFFGDSDLSGKPTVFGWGVDH